MPDLNFKGKQFVYAHHLTVPYRTLEMDLRKSLPLKPAGSGSRDGSGEPSLDDNLIIHGDNLHALKALMPRYAGRVNCIYIDPPYNTGNEGWCYNDNVNSPMMREWLKDKSPVDGEDLERHDKWLCMMWPRLQLLRELLAEDGVIFVSIDYNEDHHLRMLMDDIFNESNYRNTFVVSRVKKNIREREKIRALNFGYNSVIFYGKSENSFIVPPTRFQEKKARWHAFDAPGIRSTMNYELFGTKPPKGRHWMYAKERADDLIEQGRLRPNPRTGKPQYLLDESDQTMLDTNWTDIQEYDNKFNFPNGEKNPGLIKRIVGMSDNKDAIVLDSFAGSGTTAQAVLELNKQDGGRRKFILVECEDYADKTTAGRVRRVIQGVKDSKDENLKQGLGGSFTYCTLGEEIDVENLLTGENLPDYETLARHVAYTATGRSPVKIKKQRGKDGLFWETENRLFYLVYEPDLKFLQSSESALNADRAERIRKRAKTKGKDALVFATSKFIGQDELSKMNVTFCQLPYGIYRLVR